MGRNTNLLVVVVQIGITLTIAAVAIFVARLGNEHLSNTFRDDKHIGVDVKSSDIKAVEDGMSSGRDVMAFILKYGSSLPIKVCTGGCPDGTYDFTYMLDPYSDSYVAESAQFGCVVHRDVNYHTPDALIFYQDGISEPVFTPSDLDSAVLRSAEEQSLLEAQYEAYLSLSELKDASDRQADSSNYDPDVTKEWLRMQIKALRPSILER